MKREIEDLSSEAFAPFGQVINRPAGPQEAGGPNWHWWGGLAAWPAAPQGCAFGLLHLDPQAELRFDWAERHADSPELLAPMGCEVVIHVAPPEYPEALDQLPPLDHFRLFRLKPGQAVLMHPKVWHGAPLAPGSGTQVLVMQLQGTGAENSAVVPFSGDALTA